MRMNSFKKEMPFDQVVVGAEACKVIKYKNIKPQNFAPSWFSNIIHSDSKINFLITSCKDKLN